MNPTHEAIFRKAMRSKNQGAVLRVASVFERIGDHNKARTLYRRALPHHRALPHFKFQFGASVRGTPIAGTDGAVIPPGRYWLNIVGTPQYSGEVKRSKWLNFTMDHPEVIEEKREYSGTADNLILTVFFTIPPTATNYGLPGVHFPTSILGFPTIAGPAQSLADTSSRPPQMTSLEAIAEIPNLLGQGVQSGVQYTAETLGKAAGHAAKGVSEGLGGIPTKTLVLMGIGAIVGLALLNRLTLPKFV